jgi:hypothetical protein
MRTNPRGPLATNGPIGDHGAHPQSDVLLPAQLARRPIGKDRPDFQFITMAIGAAPPCGPFRRQQHEEMPSRVRHIEIVPCEG